MVAGQRVCKAGKGKPCYKLAYFSELRRRLNFVEAELACRRDGGQLLSVESASEQKIIEQLITELRPTDGDFWIGLRRNHRDEDSSSDCSPQYYWLDGSKSTFRWVATGREGQEVRSEFKSNEVKFQVVFVFLFVFFHCRLYDEECVLKEGVSSHFADMALEFQYQ